MADVHNYFFGGWPEMPWKKEKSMKLKIDIIVNDGSPLGVTCKSIYGEDGRTGVGGAELGLLTMCEAWHRAGYEITLYNNPNVQDGSPFEQRNLGAFNPRAERDVLITFRSPNERSIEAKGFHVWWSTDQYTVGDFRDFAPYAQKIVLISDFHKYYFAKEYGIRNTTVIDLPVRVDEYKDRGIEKVPYRCIFTSVPDRGLKILHAAWPLIKRDCKEASLVITSDYRLWGVDGPRNENHRMLWLHHQDVDFLGAVNRRRLVEEQLKAQVHPYSCTYDELFCISVAESQVAGVYPVTTDKAAVRTTNMGLVLPGRPTDPAWVNKFVTSVVSLLNMPDLDRLQRDVQVSAISRFHPSVIVKKWEDEVFQCG